MSSLLIVLVVCIVATSTATYNGTQLSDLYEEYDFIIVGGGSAGSRLAEKVSSVKHFKVLLIEAGGPPPSSSEIPMMAPLALMNQNYDWQIKSEPQKFAMLSNVEQRRTFSAGKVLGGGSTVNLMAYQRGSRSDFDNWEKKYGAEGWNWEEALKIFKRDERSDNDELQDMFHGRTGQLGVHTYREHSAIKEALFASAKSVGLAFSDTNDGDDWGYYHIQSTVRDGRRVNTFDAFLKPNLGRDNLHITLYSTVSKVTFDGKSASGVEFFKDGKKVLIKASKEVILSAGAIKTPQLLLLSGIGSKEHLMNFDIPLVHELPAVGQNFQDHVGFLGLLTEVPEDAVVDIKNVDAVHQWLIDNSGPMTSPCGMHLGVMYANVTAERKSDIEMLFLAHKNAKMDIGLETETLLSFYGPVIHKNLLQPLLVLMRPKSRGRVCLKSSNPFDDPSVDPRYFSDPQDIETLVEGAKQAVLILSSEAMKDANATLLEHEFPDCKSHEFLSENYLRCLVTHHSFNIFHPSCTCRMGRPEDPQAVVNHRLKVYGVEKLRVADCSIIPEIPSGHLNAHAILIGHKAGDFILEDHGEAPMVRSEL